MAERANRWLAKIYDRMREYLLQEDILHADETTVQVLKEPGRSAESKSYMWLYRNGRDRPPIYCLNISVPVRANTQKSF